MQEPRWPDSHGEQTDILPVVRLDEPAPPAPRRGLRRAGWISGGVLALLVVAYLIDLLTSQGRVPRGVVIAGVDVGGLEVPVAERELRSSLEPRLAQPLTITAGEARTTFTPAAAGLRLDWNGTIEQVGDQPLNPFTRLTSFFGTREIGVLSQAEDGQLGAALEDLRSRVDRAPVEGAVHFAGATPTAVEPRAGQKLDVAAARQAVLTGWAKGGELTLPVAPAPVSTTAAGVQAALDQFARPAVSGPVRFKGEGSDATAHPKDIAAALTFTPGEGGGLTPKLDTKKLTEVLAPQLKSTEQEGHDASIEFAGGKPVVKPSAEGSTVDWDKSLEPLMDTLKRTDARELKAVYRKEPAKVTTEQADKLGVREVVGEFSTGGFATDSGVNIRVVANKVNGAIVKPGETFSLNEFTGPRGKPQGYVEAGVIANGAPGREVGGGISQFATTLYNASYFAGMKDAGHKEHSYYISRYPAAREATVFQNPGGASVIDLKFTNDSDTGIAIQTIWTPSSITVKLWGTKRYTVESVPGERANPTPPPTKPGPAENCHASAGAEGFTTSDTRVLRDAGTGREVSRHTRTVHYNPQPKIDCG
ncbi:vancomycin resistance protein YoaR [Amycolatopsis sulphurea]|uniref:Vancomycin resistance protein YoaR n=1 Tax=Amycolatopsis sulphurea TaxID=76022 RepID=A0A2A9FHZ9_9PSEU|nr:VanW family protein [Amycolatopsis sulphurea]PFG50075.1 vancomycin resistance protein YoaR [Amycolatopsis sulphurea]